MEEECQYLTSTSSTRSGTLDHCLRKHLLQLCEYLYKPADVGLKVTIRMPPLVQEVSEDLSEPPTPLPPVVKINKIESSVSPKEKDGNEFYTTIELQ